MGLTFTHPFPSRLHICSVILLSAGRSKGPEGENGMCCSTCALPSSAMPVPSPFILRDVDVNLVLLLTWFKLRLPRPLSTFGDWQEIHEDFACWVGKTYWGILCFDIRELLGWPSSLKQSLFIFQGCTIGQCLPWVFMFSKTLRHFQFPKHSELL